MTCIVMPGLLHILDVSAGVSAEQSLKPGQSLLHRAKLMLFIKQIQ